MNKDTRKIEMYESDKMLNPLVKRFYTSTSDFSFIRRLPICLNSKFLNFSEIEPEIFLIFS